MAYLGIVLGSIGLVVGFVALERNKRKRFDYADAALGQLDKEQAAQLYNLAQLMARQLEQVNRVDAILPFLSEEDRQENERLIRAFYNNQLPEGD